MNPARRLLLAAVVALAGQGASAGAGIGDFDGDGNDELLLRHAQTGAWRYYALADTGAEAHALPLPTGDLYRFLGIGDFDGDGLDDVLFRRRDNGAWLYYAVQAPDVLPRVEVREGLRVTQNPAFELRGIGDLDGDARDDLVLRNTDTGEWIAYLVDGTQVQLRRGLGATRNLKYAFVGLGDYNGDGRDDLLLCHVDVGAWIAYEMNASARGVLRRLGMTRNFAFEFRGIGDLNGDGNDDVLLRNAGTGEWIQYRMSDSRSVLRRGQGVPRDAVFRFAALGDFDGDGDDSLLVRHGDAGDWVEYDLSGPTALAGHYAGLVHSLAWRDPGQPDEDVGLWTTEDGRIVLEIGSSHDLVPGNPLDLDGRTVVFTPDGEGGYTREVRALEWEEDLGEAVGDGTGIELPFGFDFGGRAGTWSA